MFVWISCHCPRAKPALGEWSPVKGPPMTITLSEHCSFRLIIPSKNDLFHEKIKYRFICVSIFPY